MSFLLMNLFSPATQASTLAAGATPKAADASAGGNSGGGAAFSAMLAGAKERLANPSAAAKSAAMLTPQTADATIAAIKQPADALALLKDAALTEQQLTELRDALRDMLDTESFAGEGDAEQAFQELHDSIEIELADMGETDVVDVEAVVMQLPTVAAAAAAPRGDMLVRIAQFLQAGIGGQAASHAKPEQGQAQLAHQNTTRTDPLLEVVQASMFHAQAIASAQTSQQSQQETTDIVAQETAYTGNAPVPQSGIVLAAYVPKQHVAQTTDSSDALPQWVRDIAPAKAEAKTEDAGDIYQGMELPELNLPGAEAQQATPEQQQAALIAQAAQVANAAPVATTPQVQLQNPQTVAEAPEAAAVQAVAQGDAKQTTGVEASLQVSTEVASDEKLPHANNEQPADELQSAPREQATAAVTQKPVTKAASQHVGIAVAAQHAQSQQQTRESLAPLPEKAGADVSLEAVQTGTTIQTMAPTHSDKLAASHAQRAANASLYQHRAEVVEQVHVAIARASKAEMDRITIQLDPADLGRVDVMMDIRRDGTTQLLVTADRRETLDMLQRDARSLERALQEAGVKADAGSMEFNLRQQQGQAAFGQGEQQFQGNGGQAQNAGEHGDKNASTSEQAILQPEVISSATYTVNGGLNVIV